MDTKDSLHATAHATAYATDNQPTEPTEDSLPMDIQQPSPLSMDNTMDPIEIQVSF
jgi:hypothetical protein